MRRKIYIELKGKIDSISLWQLIKRFGVNLMDLNEVVLIYGSVEMRFIGPLMECCARYSNFTAKVGGYDEPKESQATEQ